MLTTWINKALPHIEQTRYSIPVRRLDEFVLKYRSTDKRAVDTLVRDWERMVTFYSFPQEHWRHLRTTYIVESPFSSARLRTDASRRFRRVEGPKVMTQSESVKSDVNHQPERNAA